jgi:hypothetical protein
VNYFSHKLGESGLLDIAPTKIFPTWRNKRMGEDYIEKRLDRFLISGKPGGVPSNFQTMGGIGGESDHHPIFLEVAGDSRKPSSPFKFNSAWLKEEEFLNLVKELWNPIIQEERAMVQFSQNLKNLKKGHD